MADQFLITELVSQQGRREAWLWEYDLSKPRDLNARDRRAHYAAKRLIDVYPSVAAAENALAELTGNPS